MNVSVPIRNFLTNRRNRAVGSILGWAEAEVKPQLSEEKWEQFRRVVLDATNSYHDTVLDLVKSEDGVRNDHLVELLERVDRRLGAQARAATITPVG